MTLLTVVRDVCAAVGVTLPQSVFSGITANRTSQEMLSLANEMARRIAYDSRDWTVLKSYHTMQGNGIDVEWTLPSDFKRMLLTSNVWRSSNTLTPLLFVPDYDEWLHRRARNETHSVGEWTMAGGKMHIYPVLALGETAYYTYLRKNCITLASGGFGDSFMADGDSFLLDERVLTLGMIWQWKAHKGSPYAEDMSTYGDAMTYALGHDSPSPIIIGRSPISAYGKVAYPWQVPTP